MSPFNEGRDCSVAGQVFEEEQKEKEIERLKRHAVDLGKKLFDTVNEKLKLQEEIERLKEEKSRIKGLVMEITYVSGEGGGCGYCKKIKKQILEVL